MQGTTHTGGPRKLFFGFSEGNWGPDPKLTLHVGPDAYDLGEADTLFARTYDWVVGDRAEWDSNQTLCVALAWNEAPPPAVEPYAPANLRATAGDGQVALTWTHGWHGGSALMRHTHPARSRPRCGVVFVAPARWRRHASRGVLSLSQRRAEASCRAPSSQYASALISIVIGRPPVLLVRDDGGLDAVPT